MTRKQFEEDLADLFDDAISGSMDMDWRTIDGARECVRVLLADADMLAALAKLS